MPTYAEKLQDTRWRSFRIELIRKNENRCEECGETLKDFELQIHHVHYLRNREPWQYPEELLMCLCDCCHAETQICQEEAALEFARCMRKIKAEQNHVLAKRLRSLATGNIWWREIYNVAEEFMAYARSK